MSHGHDTHGSDITAFGSGFGTAWPRTDCGPRVYSHVSDPGQPEAEVVRVTVSIEYARYRGPITVAPAVPRPLPDLQATPRRRPHPIRRLLTALLIGAAVATPGILLARDRTMVTTPQHHGTLFRPAQPVGEPGR